MKTFILIMTLIGEHNLSSGFGGVATAEFNGLKSCQIAGKKWAESIRVKGRRDDLVYGKYVCVEKLKG